MDASSTLPCPVCDTPMLRVTSFCLIAAIGLTVLHTRMNHLVG